MARFGSAKLKSASWDEFQNPIVIHVVGKDNKEKEIYVISVILENNSSMSLKFDYNFNMIIRHCFLIYYVTE